METRPSLDTNSVVGPEAGCANAFEPPLHAKESIRPTESSFEISICDEAKGAIAEYSITEFGDKILDTLFGLGQISASNDSPLQAESIIAALDKDVHVVALGDPSKALLEGFGTPGASFWSSVIQDAPMDGVDKPLGLLQRYITLAGILVGAMSGNIPMACACFKAFVHNEIHDFGVRTVEHCFSSTSYSKPETSSKASYDFRRD